MSIGAFLQQLVVNAPKVETGTYECNWRYRPIRWMEELMTKVV
jgi:hypothetical protein